MTDFITLLAATSGLVCWFVAAHDWDYERREAWSIAGAAAFVVAIAFGVATCAVS